MDENNEQQSFSERMQESKEASEQEPQQESTNINPQSGGDAPTEGQEKKTTGGGVNKYIVIVGVIILIVVSGGVYRSFFVAEIDKPIVTGEERFLTIITHENTWRFDPETIEAEQGDRITLTIINEDEYDHGFAIDAFGISQRMPAKSTIVVDLVVTKAGDFPFYCSVSCGSGVVDGEERGHFDQIGRLHVRSLISETVDYGETEAIDFAAEARKSAIIQEASRALGVDEDQIKIDTDNIEWLRSGEIVESLEGVEYQALYIITIEEHSSSNRDWVFIDTTTGEVVGSSSHSHE